MYKPFLRFSKSGPIEKLIAGSGGAPAVIVPEVMGFQREKSCLPAFLERR